MKVPSNFKVGLIFYIIISWTIMAKTVLKEGEIEVKLQFLEYELEDFCVSKNEAEWKFLNGSEPDLKKLLDIEIKESNFYKHEIELLQNQTGKKFSHKKLKRLMTLFTHPGAPLLGNMEFREYRDYSRRLQELIATTKTQCYASESTTFSELQKNFSNSEKKCSPSGVKEVNKFLYTEKNEDKLKGMWSKWFRALEEKNKKTKYDFVQQLSMLDLEAEQNGEEELADYWLKQGDITWVNYEQIQDLWKEILPLYDKLKQYIRSLVIQNYGKEILRDQNIIPIHILGSLESYDWITAVDKLGGFDGSENYKSIKQSLEQKTVKDLYKISDDQTAELKLGNLPQSFYEKSRFNESSQTCQNKITDYCERENAFRVMFCSSEVPSVKSYIQINEDVMKMKYLLLSGKEEEENGFLFRTGPRESVLYEAVQGLSSLRTLWPEYLDSIHTANHSQQHIKILSLFITALHVIPPLPYYLASDLWRINALKEIDVTAGENMDTTTESVFSSAKHSSEKKDVLNKTAGDFNITIVEEKNTKESQINNGAEPNESNKIYETQNLTSDWWKYRERYQSVGSTDGELYEDYLQDRNIIWNKSYLSKFLGKILQFQILEKTENLTVNLMKMIEMLQKGKSEPWEFLVEETFNITEISTKPLLSYFKPLEEFLEKNIKLKNQTQLFNFDDFNFISQGFSLNPINNETEGEKPAEGSDALFFSLAVIAAVGVIAVIVTIGRRRYRKRQRARERRRRLAEL